MNYLKVLGIAGTLAVVVCTAAGQTTIPSSFNGVNLNVTDGTSIGQWAPDARLIDPALSVTDIWRSPTAPLDTFYGMDPNREWTLFLQDLDTGFDGTLAQWSVVVTQVPEPSAAVLLGLGGLAFGLRPWRRRSQ